jgi:hypothetical protein
VYVFEKSDASEMEKQRAHNWTHNSESRKVGKLKITKEGVSDRTVGTAATTGASQHYKIRNVSVTLW